MKFVSLTIVCSALVVAGCSTTTDAEMAAKPAVTESAYAPLIGKQLVSDGVTFIINADGTMSGQARGEAVVGTYKIDGDESCSIYTAPEFLTGREFCSVPTITGNTVVFNRRDGTTSPVYTIKG